MSVCECVCLQCDVCSGQLAVLEAEVNRLNLTVKVQQEEACPLREKVTERAELRH